MAAVLRRCALRRRRWLVAAAVLALSLASWLTSGGGSLGYDAAYALAWAEDVLAGRLPGFEAPVAPTPHPLLNLLALAVTPLGSAADEALLACAHVAAAALVVTAAVLAARIAGPIAGVAAGAIVLTRAAVVDNTLFAGIDVGFAALVLGALAVEARSPRAGRPVLALLALAGCLRPDAWVLSLLYLGYVLARAPAQAAERSRGRAGLVLLAIGAPLLWMSWDLVVTSHPLHSLLSTRDLAAALDRPRGLGTALSLLPAHLALGAGTAIAVCGALGGLAALVLVPARARPALSVLALGCASFLALGLTGLPLIGRYAFLSAILLCVFAGVVAGLPPLTPARWRGRAQAAAAGLLVAMLVAAPPQLRRGANVREEARARTHIQAELERLATQPAVAAVLRACPQLWSSSYRPLPLLAVWLDRPVDRLAVGAPAAGEQGVVVAPATIAVAQRFRLRAIDGSPVLPALPENFAEIARTADWRAYARCDACRSCPVRTSG